MIATMTPNHQQPNKTHLVPPFWQGEELLAIARECLRQGDNAATHRGGEQRPFGTGHKRSILDVVCNLVEDAIAAIIQRLGGG